MEKRHIKKCMALIDQASRSKRSEDEAWRQKDYDQQDRDEARRQVLSLEKSFFDVQAQLAKANAAFSTEKAMLERMVVDAVETSNRLDAAEARVKELEQECANSFSLSGELEVRDEIEQKLRARVKELEAE